MLLCLERERWLDVERFPTTLRILITVDLASFHGSVYLETVVKTEFVTELRQVELAANIQTVKLSIFVRLLLARGHFKLNA